MEQVSRIAPVIYFEALVDVGNQLMGQLAGQLKLVLEVATNLDSACLLSILGFMVRAQFQISVKIVLVAQVMYSLIIVSILTCQPVVQAEFLLIGNLNEEATLVPIRQCFYIGLLIFLAELDLYLRVDFVQIEIVELLKHSRRVCLRVHYQIELIVLFLHYIFTI